MDQETVILNEVRQRQITYVEPKKKKKKGGTKERTYRTERVTHVENKFIIMAGQR